MENRTERIILLRQDSDDEPRNIGHFLDRYLCSFIGLVVVIIIIWIIIEL